MSAKYKSPSFLLPNELNTSANPANDTGINSLYSIKFNGSSDYIDVGNPTELQLTGAFSVSLWMKTIATGTGAFVAKDNNASNPRGFSVEFNNSAPGGYFVIYNGTTTYGVYVFSSDANYINIRDNNWHHIVAVYTPSTSVALFVDGNFVKSNTTNIPASVNFVNDNLNIGRRPQSGGVNYFNGKIDEVAIFNRALDSTEISALYDGSGSNIRPSNLMATNLNPIAYYPLGEQAQMQGYLGNEASSEWQFPNGVLQDYVMDFDGSKDYIDASTLSVIGDWSVSLWVNSNSTSYQTALQLANSTTTGTNDSLIFLYSHPGGASAKWGFYDGSTTLIGLTALDTNQWYNLVVTKSGTTYTLFLNGTQENQNTKANINIEDLLIGKRSANVFYMDGQMSNVQIFNSALPATGSNSVETIYNNGSPLVDMSGFTSLTNWWKLNADSVYTPSAPNYTTALSFVDTPGDKIEITSPSSSMQPTTTLTLSFWANFKQDANWMLSNGGWGQSSSAYSGYSIQTYNGRSLKFWIGNGTASGSFTTSASVFNLNQWHHILITYDSGTAILYIDGNVVPWSGTGGINSIAYSASYNPFFGSVNSGGTSFNAYEGFLSNAAIFNTALTPSQVSTLFNFGTPETNISFSPTAWWKLDNTTTGIQDSSGNGNNGTNNGTTQVSSSVAVVPSWKIPSALTIPTINYKTALDFDGNTNYVTAGTTSYLNNVTEMSLSIWFNLDTAAQNKGLISDYNGTTTGHFALVTKGILGNNYSLRLYMNNGGPESSIQIANQPFIAGQWHNLVMIYANSTISFYIDGQPAASSAYSGTTPSSFANSTNTLNIGKYSTLEWNGLISNAQIWTTELSSSDALSIYNNGQPSTTAFGSPVSWWKLDSTTITDSAGSNNGTNNGAAQVTSDVYSGNIPVNGVSTTLPSTALQQSDLQFDSPYSNYSLSFDGTGDYIDCTDISYFSGADRFTLSTWFKVDSSDDGINNRDIISKGSTSSGTTSFLLRKQKNGNGNKIQVAFDEGITNFYSTTQIQNNIWYHVVIVYKGYESNNADRLGIYVDGQNVTASYTNTVPTTLVSSTQPLRIGRWASGTDFYGNIDETAIWQSVLTDAQILQVYNNGRPSDLTSSGTAPIYLVETW